MDHRIIKVLDVVALLMLPISTLESQTVLQPLLRDPSRADWSSLSRFSGTLTRAEFEQRLMEVFDPFMLSAPSSRLPIAQSGSSPLRDETNWSKSDSPPRLNRSNVRLSRSELFPRSLVARRLSL